jgi:NhaC family Na+:H+ antiporter
MGIDPGMTAGAVISGAYFGDKLSPLSDTTNLAAAMAGATLFDHIKHMTVTTIPSYVITLFIFLIIGFNINVSGTADISDKLGAIDASFNVSPWLFMIPAFVIFMIMKKTEPLIALLAGALLGGVAAIIFQPDLVVKVAEGTQLTFNTAYKGVLTALTTKTSVATTHPELNDLFAAKGMEGMLGTIWLILCAIWWRDGRHWCSCKDQSGSTQYVSYSFRSFCQHGLVMFSDQCNRFRSISGYSDTW